MGALEITANNFEQEVMQSSKPVFLDFWSPSCGPCLRILPIVDEIAAEVDDVKIAKVNIAQEMDLARKFGVSSIPFLAIVKDGKMVDSTLGARPKEDLLEFIAPYRV